MVGVGSCFLNIGISVFKYEIKVKGEILFYWFFLLLKDFFDCIFLFVVCEGLYNEVFLLVECKCLGISDWCIVVMDKMIDGQVGSVLFVDDVIVGDDVVVVFNIDIYVELGKILKFDIFEDVVGYLFVFLVEGDKWSFVKMVLGSMRVMEVFEKIWILNLGMIGFYYFCCWLDFKFIYVKYINVIWEKYWESYIVLMYVYLIVDG